MADDVKVKFGGDFTDVPKGAEAAANAAGTAMRGYFNTYAKGLKDKLASAFSLDSLITNFASRVSAQLEKFKEIDTMSRKLGIGREELQKFAKIGEEFNLDMETMGRSIQFANKTLGAAAMGNKEAQQKLLELKFTQEEVNSKHIKATDVLSKLAEEYEKNKKIYGEIAASNTLAKQTTDLFGRAGSDLIPILKENNEELKKRINLLSVYSDSEVKAGAAAQRAYEKMEKRFNKTIIGRFIGGSADIIESQELFGNFGEGGIMEQALKKSGFGSKSDVKSREDVQKLSENFMSLAKQEGYGPEDLVRAFQVNLDTATFLTKHAREVTEDMQMNFSNAAHQSDVQESKLNSNKVETAASNVTALAASSLQQIGGGDINSVMSGLATNQIADNTLRMANTLDQMAGKEAPKPGPQTLK